MNKRAQLEAQCAQDCRSSRLENAVHTVRKCAPGDTKRQKKLLAKRYPSLIAKAGERGSRFLNANKLK